MNAKTIDAENRVPRELHGKRLLGYNFGYFGLMLNNLLIAVFIFQFYVYTINLSAIIVSIGMAVQLIVGALCSIVFGVLIDNKKPGKFGKRRPYLLYLLPLWGLTSFLIWIPPFYCPEGETMYLPVTVYFLVVIILNSISGISIFIAYASMLPEQSQTLENRKKVASTGAFLAIVASIFAMALPLVIQSVLPEPDNVKWWEPSGEVVLLLMPIVGIIFVIFGIISIFLTFFSVDESFHARKSNEVVEKTSLKDTIHQLSIPAKDKKFKKLLSTTFFINISGRIIGIVIIPFLTYVLQFSGSLFFIYIIIAIICKFGGFYFWKAMLVRYDLIKTFTLCLTFSVVASFFELLFLVNVLSFEIKIALFATAYGTVLAGIYAFGLFSAPITSALIEEAASDFDSQNNENAISNLSGAYFGLLSFITSMGLAISSIFIGFILVGTNEENPIIITILLASTGIFYFIALMFLRKIKLKE